MSQEFPVSYKDSLYASLDSENEAKHGLPPGLLSSVRTKGERSNHNQTNSLGTQTVYQFIPATKKAILDKYGIDVSLSPKNASEGAALLLKEGLQRNKGDPALATAEYIGGLDRSRWGPQTKAYVSRVMEGHEPAKLDDLKSGFAKFMADNPAVPADSPSANPAQPAEKSAAASDLIAGFGEYLKTAPAPAEEAPPMGILDSLKESVTGEQRRTPQTDAAPDWAGMPELNQLSMASAKTGLGTLLSNPQETAQIIKANFPGVEVRQDEKGNFLLKSSVDGQEYGIKPGFQPSDIPRAAAAVVGFTPAGRATSIGGAALAGGATQAAVEASQSATGGNFDAGEVGVAALVGGGVPAIGRAVKGVANKAQELLPGLRSNPAAQAAAAVPPPAAAPVQATPAPPMTGTQLASATKTAASGGLGSKKATQALAEQAAPDAKVVESAKRLGIEDYLQPDHVTTNQAYRELSQAVKSIPGSESRAAEIVGLEKVAQRADGLIDELGGTTDVSSVNSTIKNRIQSTVTDLEKRSDELFTKVRTAIPAKATASVDNTLGFLEKHADEVGGAERLLPVEKKLLADLGGEGGPITYAYLDQTRKQIGKALRKASGPFADSEEGLLKKLYSNLSVDQSVAADAHGALDLFKAANASVVVRKGLEDDLISLFGKSLDGSIVRDLAGGMRALSSGDTSKFLGLIKAVPQESRQMLVASGLASAFKTAGTRGPINFNTYSKWYEGLLKNKQAHAALMANLPPQARKQLSDLYRVSRAVSSATRERITTGRIQAVQEQFKDADTLAGKIYDGAKRHAVSATAGTVAGAVGGPGLGAAVASALSRGAKPDALKAADALISSPQFIQLTKAPPAGRPQAIKRFANSGAFRRYVKAVGAPREMSDKEKWIQKALQGNNQKDK